MIVELKNLNYGTVFEYKGRIYKSKPINWIGKMVLLSKKSYIGDMPDDYSKAIQISPKLGGKFQDSIEIWASENLKVNVE